MLYQHHHQSLLSCRIISQRIIFSVIFTILIFQAGKLPYNKSIHEHPTVRFFCGYIVTLHNLWMYNVAMYFYQPAEHILYTGISFLILQTWRKYKDLCPVCIAAYWPPLLLLLLGRNNDSYDDHDDDNDCHNNTVYTLLTNVQLFAHSWSLSFFSQVVNNKNRKTAWSNLQVVRFKNSILRITKHVKQ